MKNFLRDYSNPGMAPYLARHKVISNIEEITPLTYQAPYQLPVLASKDFDQYRNDPEKLISKEAILGNVKIWKK